MSVINITTINQSINQSISCCLIFTDDDFDDTEGLDEGYGQDLGYHMVK